MNEVPDVEALDACLKESTDHPIWILKHSTACPVSGAAHERVAEHAEEADEEFPPVYLVKVIEARPVSNAVAERLGVQHQSPQLILVRDGKAVWSASHFSITGENMDSALKELS